MICPLEWETSSLRRWWEWLDANRRQQAFGNCTICHVLCMACIWDTPHCTRSGTHISAYMIDGTLTFEVENERMIGDARSNQRLLTFTFLFLHWIHPFRDLLWLLRQGITEHLTNKQNKSQKLAHQDSYFSYIKRMFVKRPLGKP